MAEVVKIKQAPNFVSVFILESILDRPIVIPHESLPKRNRVLPAVCNCNNKLDLLVQRVRREPPVFFAAWEAARRTSERRDDANADVRGILLLRARARARGTFR
jgi:hypothetical protein